MKQLLRAIVEFIMAVFDRIIGRLHRVFNKEPQAAPAFFIRNHGPFPFTITITHWSITAVNAITTITVPVTAETTIADLAAAWDGTDLHIEIIDADRANSLLIGLAEDTLVLPPDYLDQYIYAENGQLLLAEDGQAIMTEG